MSVPEGLIDVRKVSKIYEGPGMRGNPLSLFARKARPAVAASHLKVHALRSVSVRFDRGEFTAIAGPSGSGKTTLFNIIGTLDAPSSGEVRYRGRTMTGRGVDELAEFRLHALGFVFQSYNLIPVLSARENVEYVLSLQGVEPQERRERSLQALKSVGLAPHSERRPDLLSGGQQQRVAIARSIVHRPIVVLADEPTANLDSKTSVDILELMAQLNEEQGITFLFSSHDPFVLERARRVVRIRGGKIEGEGPSAK